MHISVIQTVFTHSYIYHQCFHEKVTLVFNSYLFRSYLQRHVLGRHQSLKAGLEKNRLYAGLLVCGSVQKKHPYSQVHSCSLFLLLAPIFPTVPCFEIGHSNVITTPLLGPILSNFHPGPLLNISYFTLFQMEIEPYNSAFLWTE